MLLPQNRRAYFTAYFVEFKFKLKSEFLVFFLLLGEKNLETKKGFHICEALLCSHQPAVQVLRRGMVLS